MSNYTMVDLRMDYKKDTGNTFVQYFDDTKCEDVVDYIQYLERELIEYRDQDKKFMECTLWKID